MSISPNPQQHHPIGKPSLCGECHEPWPCNFTLQSEREHSVEVSFTLKAFGKPEQVHKSVAEVQRHIALQGFQTEGFEHRIIE